MTKDELIKSLSDGDFTPNEETLKMVYGHGMYDKEWSDRFFKLYTDKGYDMADYNRLVIEIEGRQAEIEKNAAQFVAKHSKKQQEQKNQDPLFDLKVDYYSISQEGKPTKPLDDKIAQYVIDNNHIIVINNRPYVYKNGVYKLDKDGKTVKSLIKVMLLEKDKKATTIKGIYNLIIDNPEISFNYEEVNKYPKHWINFKNGMLDVKTMTMHDHSPGHYSINQIPHNYEPDAVYKDTVADLFIRDIVPDKADRDMFYTYCGYCMTTETFLQKFLVIIGAPGTGKSTLLNMVIETIGEDNISAIELDQINKQFMSTFLVGNLVNICADLPKRPLQSVDVIKRITGEDLIKCEIKGGDVFTTRLYLKLAFSTNEMPISLDEQSNAWYRRLLMLNIPQKGKRVENLTKGLRESIPGFIALCVRRLNALYQTKPMTIDSPNSLQLVAEYHHDSDSVQSWLDDCCERVQDARTDRVVAYEHYKTYCEDNELKDVSRNNFYKRMQSKGFEQGRTSKERYFKNLKIVTSECQLLTEKCQESDTNFKQVDIEDTPFKGIFLEK